MLLLDKNLGETGWPQRSDSVATAHIHRSCIESSSLDDTGSVYIYKFTLAVVSGEQVCGMSLFASLNVETAQCWSVKAESEKLFLLALSG